MSKYNALLKKAEFFEKLALYSDRRAFLQALAQSGPVSQEEFHGSTMVGDSGEPSPAASKPAPVSNPAILTMQTQLNDLLVSPGYNMPIKMDGIDGRQTQDALRIFKEKFPKFPATMQGVAKAHNPQTVGSKPAAAPVGSNLPTPEEANKQREANNPYKFPQT